MAEEFGCLDLVVDEDFLLDFTESPIMEDFTHSSPGSVNSWIGEIESQLMNDEQLSFSELDHQLISEFIADVFVDHPACPVVDDSAAAQLSEIPAVAETEPQRSDDSGKEKKSDASNDGEDVPEGNDDDVVAKKRTRRLRNRDAAVRSRERKKEYVQDLERKSKYLERECMRLGRMLDCFVAENHSLRLYLQKGSGDPSMTKQESAVLLLESLLLGSLLWFLGSIICQFPQHGDDTKSCCLLQVQTPPLEEVVLSGQGRSRKPSCTTETRRCKGSRPRMKHYILTVLA